jgi:hypothetical protein
MHHVPSPLLPRLRLSTLLVLPPFPVPDRSRQVDSFLPAVPSDTLVTGGTSHQRHRRRQSYSLLILQRLAHSLFHLRRERIILCCPLPHQMG